MRSLITSFAVLLLCCVGCSSEDELSGPRPLALSASDPNSTTTCGNGFCEDGESHASCANDCCELGPNDACLAQCGNGFCDGNETHASCAADCCAC